MIIENKNKMYKQTRIFQSSVFEKNSVRQLNQNSFSNKITESPSG